MTKLFTKAEVPPELIHEWLQHLRNFDTAHPGCHFEVLTDAPDMTLSEMIEAVQVNPAMTFTTIFERGKKS